MYVESGAIARQCVLYRMLFEGRGFFTELLITSIPDNMDLHYFSISALSDSKQTVS